MVRVGVLQCPTCEKLTVYRMDRIEDRETRKELASMHLRTHRLDESKAGIHRITMADQFERVELDDTTDVSIGEWLPGPELPAALTERVESIPVPQTQH